MGGAFAVGSHHCVAGAGNGLKQPPDCRTAQLCVQSTLVLRPVYLPGFCFCLGLKVFQGILVPSLRGEMILTLLCSCCFPAFLCKLPSDTGDHLVTFLPATTGGTHLDYICFFLLSKEVTFIYYLFIFAFTNYLFVWLLQILVAA